ncbi:MULTISPECIES: helix-turn-helix domain-containing protein [Streptococcus]|nr:MULTISPECIES: helix-turn-helix transcriptional regulator [Streptococcus]MBS6531513.1 helix-turn-helix transcriptional regulator [Streptococcus salivarius]MBS6931867.1 helix-turn-helix transcriptional regulator [Streptococcus sp.]MDU3724776.1 helix-turn-helix transcriptional regulator [Clostridium celatum]MDU5565286.1 helix-turn-helix transcriptional regulator [Streptococcus vestibularis]
MKIKQISQYKLLKSGIDNKTLDSLKKDKNITLLTLEKLCRILDCSPNEIVKFIDETPNNQH